LLQEKVKKAKQMQMGMAAQQPKRPSVAEQVGQEAQQATITDIMKAQALRMQGEMGQTGGISDSLPKPEGYAKGGPIAFADGDLVPNASLYENDLAIDEATALRALSPEQRKYYSMFPNGKELAINHGMQELSKHPDAFVGASDAIPRTTNYTKNVPYYRTEAPQPKDPLRMPLEDFVNRKGAPIPEWYTEGGKYVDRAGDVLGDYTDKAGDYLTRKGIAGTAIDASKKAYLSGKNVMQGAGEGLIEGYNYAAPIANKIMWGTEGQAIPQEAKPTPNVKDLVAQARAKPFGESNLPMLEGYGNSLMPVAIDRRAPVAQPVTENILNKNAPNRQTPDVDQAQAMQDRIVTRKAPPVMGGNAPAPTQTPYAQAAAPATQTQPAQEEEKDLTLAERMKEYRDVTGENKGIDALRGRLSEREARLAKEEDRAPWMALMQAGLSTMAGTSPNALTNIGQGGAAGLQAYTRSMNKLEDAKDKSFDIQAKLEEAQRGEVLAAAKYGLDSVQADKKARATAKLEREKMANDFNIHERANATNILGHQIQAGATRYSADARADMYGRVKDKGNITQYQYGQLVDKASDNVDKMIKDQMLGFTMSPEELSTHRQRMIEAEIQRMVGGMGGGMMPTQPVAANTGILPGYRMVHKQLSQQ
jgi:hypothetical protein